jgi:enoyl-CoA hydratase/carnithine racemase
MLQHCDFVYAGRSTKFSLPFINFGLPAEGGSTLVLAQGAGARQAARWLLLGEGFTADEALAAGLLTEVLDDDAALAKARETATRLAAFSPEALRINKMLLRQAKPALMQTLESEIDQFTTLLEGETAQAALRRFTEKTKR